MGIWRFLIMCSIACTAAVLPSCDDGGDNDGADGGGAVVPVSCSNGQVFPAAAAERPEDFVDAAVIGVVVRDGMNAPLAGIELAIREFALSADQSALDVIAMTCVVDADATDADAQLQDAARYLSDEIDANVLMVAGLPEDLQTVIDSGTGFDLRDQSSSPTIFPFSGIDPSQGGGIIFSTVPSRDATNLALAERVSQAIGTPGETPVQVAVFRNTQVFRPTDSAALDAALYAAIGDPTVDVSLIIFSCNCHTGCTEESIRPLLDDAVDDATSAGEELHIVVSPGCDRAAKAVGAALDTLAGEPAFDDFLAVVSSITLSGDAFSKTAYADLSELDMYEGFMRGVSAAGNPGSEDYQAFQNSYQSVLGDQTGLTVSPLVAHAADATWLAILGYLAAYVENGDSTDGLSSADIRASMRRFIDSDVCSTDECPEALSFPRTVAAFEQLSWTLLNDEDATFQMTGASGPLRFTNANSATVAEPAFFTQWTITNPETCLIPFGGEATESGSFFCSVLSDNPEDYVLYPKGL